MFQTFMKIGENNVLQIKNSASEYRVSFEFFSSEFHIEEGVTFGKKEGFLLI